MNTKACLNIPAREIFLGPAISFIKNFAYALAVNEPDWEDFRNAVESILKIIIDNNASGTGEPLNVCVSEADEKLVVEIRNQGLPIFLGNEIPSNTASAGLAKKFRSQCRKIDEISTENLGREGQLFVLKKRLGKGAAQRAFQPAAIEAAPQEISNADVTLRRLAAHEASSLSQLFYRVYGYSYINETIYFPEKLKVMMQDGRLISTAAVLPDGRLAGHVGLIRKADQPVCVYEAALGLVDPALKSRRLFARIFKKTMEIVAQTPMHYLVFDFVTNHDLSQRFISRFGTCDMALFVGCQTKVTQASLEKIGLGSDPEDMDRYTILFSIIPRVEHPFGREIYLPERLGEPLGYLLKPLGITWLPAPRFDSLDPEGRYRTSTQPEQQAVIFDMSVPGRHAVEQILRQWRELQADGYEYAAVEVPLDVSGIGLLYEALSAEGFFVSGFIPYRMSNRLGFRFQALGPSKVAFDKIRLATEPAKQLLDIILEEQKVTV